jgi:1-pyrroline-5-carboxylate dehydrogenase
MSLSGKPAFDKIMGYIQKAKDAGGEVIIGGSGMCLNIPAIWLTLTARSGDDSTGYFVQPTVIVTKDPKSVTMVEEIFGPVITVCPGLQSSGSQ